MGDGTVAAMAMPSASAREEEKAGPDNGADRTFGSGESW